MSSLGPVGVGGSRAADILCLYIGMEDEDMSAGYPLTGAVTLALVTTRTLIRSLALVGIEWVPVSFDDMPATAAEGLYTWAIGPAHEDVDPLDRPVGYIGIGVSKAGGVRGRLLQEVKLISNSAAHAHGRAMFRLQGSPLGGPVQQIEAANLGPVEETILASRFSNREQGLQELKAWLSNPALNLVGKAEQLCIRAAIHVGDTPPPLNGHHAGAWGTNRPCDWGGWAIAQLLGAGNW
jgi:hypothetical protein